ncbi:gas vesicle accessory protein GvpU [Priestia koreensis]|uniref:gas vesicle accessory protein GvpU n=1 Tax=Priestia koreensis TaxID=284581 RepID=UPI00203ADB19|nr:gas vesicle accessory protein GvpU [Priestia koreensis]MCM3003562.1 gas vesicle protein GvpU [Priestia koreensis]
MSSEVTKDSILEFFVTASNKHDFALDITLNLKGAIVSGTTISAREYFEQLSESFTSDSDVSEALSEQLSSAGEAANADDVGEAHFIHLKDARIYCGDSKPTPSKGKILWRGKLSEIDGFCLGKISETKKTTSKKSS